MRLAICDDDPEYRILILRILESILTPDDVTETFCNGFALVEAFRKRSVPFDAVLLDMQMPGMSEMVLSVML